MKQWTMPRVEVERFAANEYVAACKQAFDVLSHGNKEYWYIDVNHNGIRDTEPNESFTPGNNSHMITRTAFQALGGKSRVWKESMNVYYSSTGLQGSGTSYSRADNHYVVDVFIESSMSAKFYQAGTAGSFDPDHNKNYS